MTITAMAAALAALATVVVVAVPSFRFAYSAPAVRVSVETGAALIALIASYLVLGRFRRGRHLDDLVLATGFGILSLSNLFATILLAVQRLDSERLAANGATVAGAVVLACAAYSPRTPVVRHRHAGLVVLAGSAALVGVAIGALFAIDEFFEPGTTGVVATNAARPHFESHVDLLVVQVLSMSALALAAFGFARRADAEHDTFLQFVAVGTTLGAFARAHYLLFAPLQTGWIRTGDIFRAGFYVVLLVGAGREIEQYWRRLAQTAVLEERRRIARDLHDGVAQELAFIGRRAQRLAAKTGLDAAREIAASAERALGDSRRAIAALTKPLDQPLASVLTEAVEEVAARHEVQLDLAINQGVEVGADAREALVRIACEAVSNAARHGGADVVRVELSNTDGVVFAVSDDGTGFDPEQPTHARFGLVIMRERAQAVGGAFRLVSSPGHGTQVEVRLP